MKIEILLVATAHAATIYSDFWRQKVSSWSAITTDQGSNSLGWRMNGSFSVQIVAKGIDPEF